MVSYDMSKKKKNAANIGFIGGRLCLDFTNTIEWRGRADPIELLSDYQDLVTWGRRQGILTDQKAHLLLKIAARQKNSSHSVLKRARVLREALYHIFSKILQHQAPSRTDMSVFNRELSEAMARAEIQPASDGFQWGWTAGENPLEQVLWPIVHDAAKLLASEMLPRLGMCSDKNCAWLFLDASKNHKRRWCSMNDCGNRAKALRHYRRKRRNIGE